MSYSRKLPLVSCRPLRGVHRRWGEGRQFRQRCAGFYLRALVSMLHCCMVRARWAWLQEAIVVRSCLVEGVHNALHIDFECMHQQWHQGVLCKSKGVLPAALPNGWIGLRSCPIL